jgi:hypothetical protein
MGLDMFLTRSKFIWGDEKVNLTITAKKEKDKKEVIDDKKEEENLFILYEGEEIQNIDIEVMYWRKANAIHKWFVDNIQEGKDDCDKYYVPTEELEKLLSDIEKVLEDHEKAPKLIPVVGGFFFGGTNYDEWYFKNLENTLEKLKKYIEKDDKDEYKINCMLYYQSSW